MCTATSTEGRSSLPLRKQKVCRNSPIDTLPQGKRQRVSQACNQCRSKKERCDGQHPICSNCDSVKLLCTYGSNQRRRGLPAGYVRVLEMLWGLVFCKVDGSQDVVNSLLTQMNGNGHADWLVHTKRDGDDAESLLHIWRKSKAFDLVQRLLKSIDESRDEERSLEGSTQDEPTTIQLVWHNPSTLPSEGYRSDNARENRESDHANADICSVHKTFQSASHSQSSLNAPLPILPSNRWHLLEVYFSFTHCWFPILERHDIIRAAYNSSGRNLRVRDVSSESGVNAALWAALTYASIQEEATSSVMADGGALNSEELYRTARSLIPSEDFEFGLGHVQALLLLGLYKLGCGSKNAAWLLINHAVRIAVTIGMEDFDAIGRMEAPSDRSQHVYLGCFALETLISVVTGRLPYLTSESINRLGPLLEAGLEEWDLWVNKAHSDTAFPEQPLHTLSVFNQFIGLFRILNDLMHEKKSGNIHLIYQAKISHWHGQLPEHCHFSTTQISTDPTSTLPHIWNLRLMYTSAVTIIQTRALQHQEISENDAKTLIEFSTNVLIAMLEQYREAYKSSSLPATVVYYVHVAQSAIESGRYTDGDGLQPVFQNLLSRLRGTWPGADSDRMFSHSNLDCLLASLSKDLTSFNNQIPRQPEAFVQSIQPRLTYESNQPKFTENPDMINDFTAAFPDSSAAIEAAQQFSIFDQLASLDGTEWLDRQPQFMQNLGFGSDNISSNFLSQHNWMDFMETEEIS